MSDSETSDSVPTAPLLDPELLALVAQKLQHNLVWTPAGAAILVDGKEVPWNPINDDGDAFRMRITLNVGERKDSMLPMYRYAVERANPGWDAFRKERYALCLTVASMPGAGH